MPPRSRPATAKEAAAFLVMGGEFLEAANDSFAHGRLNAAASCAIHAGIAAGDAFCAAKLGQRSASPNHQDAIQLLRSVKPDGAKLAQLLERLLQNKTRAEYDPDPISKAVAQTALKHATRLVELVRDTIG